MRFFNKYVPGNRQINKALLWEFDTNDIDIDKCKTLIAERTIEIGVLEDFYAAFDLFGGIQEFADIAKNNITGLSDKGLNFLCVAFGIKKEETKCYKNRLLRQKHIGC
ncbi:MAG: hypothetical protein IJS62_07125 [Bacteroidales bacterium]|nr:hypothetical protein [Bacteroidales bacterium]MBR0299786.1 hypothetical protein [Bacteroidales bacterium]